MNKSNVKGMSCPRVSVWLKTKLVSGGLPDCYFNKRDFQDQGKRYHKERPETKDLSEKKRKLKQVL